MVVASTRIYSFSPIRPDDRVITNTSVNCQTTDITIATDLNARANIVRSVGTDIKCANTRVLAVRAKHEVNIITRIQLEVDGLNPIHPVERNVVIAKGCIGGNIRNRHCCRQARSTFDDHIAGFELCPGERGVCRTYCRNIKRIVFNVLIHHVTVQVFSACDCDINTQHLYVIVKHVINSHELTRCSPCTRRQIERSADNRV